VVVAPCSLHVSTFVTKFISEPVLDSMLGCCTVSYCFVFVSHSDQSGQRFFFLLFSLLDSQMVVITTGLFVTIVVFVGFIMC
jgi:hypothetical protein